MKPKRHILSSRLTLKFANTGKREFLDLFRIEYSRVATIFISRFWGILNSKGKVPALPGKNLTQIKTWLSARAVQACAKQASGIVNGALAKNKRREWQAKQFDKLGHTGKARKLREIIAQNRVSAPKIESLEPQLDGRFFRLGSGKTFNEWLTLVSTGHPTIKKFKLAIPLKFHRHFNALSLEGQRLNTVRIGRDSLSFSFELPDCKANGEILGIDVGQRAVFSTSRGEQTKEAQHGWTLAKISERMARRKRGSKGFRRAEELRKNFVGYTVNRLNLHGIGVLRLEKIRYLKRGRRTSRLISHWSYPRIFGALRAKARRCGVRVEEVQPAFTSQRCFKCGWVCRENRTGEFFACKSCGNADNADVNAAKNVSLGLEISPTRCGSPATIKSCESIVRKARKPSKPSERAGLQIFQ